jgi:hypothetical protein
MRQRPRADRSVSLGSLFVHAALLPLLTACGPGGRALPGGVRLADDVVPEHAERIEADLQRLEGMSLSPGDEDFRASVGIAGASGTELLGWLAERVRVIVGGEIPDDRISLGREAEFPATPLPKLERSRPEWGAHRACRAVAERPELWERIWGPKGDGNRPVTVMSNFGAALYYGGKRAGALLEVRPYGMRPLTVDSPRIGLIEIGQGLFKHENPASAAASLSRLSVFFHEGRHSDGNGDSLSFFHSVCPRGHALAGALACDRTLNGPYRIGGEIARHIAENCAPETCGLDEAAREELRIEYLDSFSRVIETERVPEDCRRDADRASQSSRIREQQEWFLSDEPSLVPAEAGVARCRDFVQAVENEDRALAVCDKAVRRARVADAQPERAR